MKTENILIVDDEELNRRILKNILSERYTILEADNAKTALELLKDKGNHISAVILDIIMPEYDGYYFLEGYSKSNTLRAIPVLVSTGEDSQESESKCLEMGAWDFVKKPYSSKIILCRLRNAVEKSKMHVLKELVYREQYDLLTGFYCKNKFIEETQNMLEANPDKEFALVRIDIYKFQLVNRFYGMQEGDRLLKKMAESIRSRAKIYDLFLYCRTEADIFYVCFPFKNEEGIASEASLLRNTLKEYRRDYDVVPVFGIYRIKGEHISIPQMMDRATLASKKCKGNYVNNYAFYTEDMIRDIIKEQEIVNSMNAAMEEERFVLYLQPKYDLLNNRLAGAEVLIRWKEGDTKMIAPNEFIPVFERNGFIMELDYYVLEHSCRLLRRWIDEGKNPEPISVNISRVSLYNPNLVQIIEFVADKYEIAPRLLQLELTESAYTSNPQGIKDAMVQLQKKGFAILMDDFGSGYSSLNVLKDIAVDILKIDMKFMENCDQPDRSENILASVVRMAKWLNTPVIAEGVEKKEQVTFLREIGCEYIQGYYFAKPMPVEEYEKKVFEEGGVVEQVIEEPVEEQEIWTPTSQMELMFSTMIQAVAVYECSEAQAELIRVNKAYYDLFGYEDMESPKMAFRRGVVAEYRETIQQAFQYAIATKDMAVCEFKRIVNRNGIPLWLQLQLKYVRFLGGKHILYGTFTDITAQKAMDLELRKYRTALLSAERKAETILIVDDVEMNRDILTDLFEEEYQIFTAKNGKEALEILEEYPKTIDLVLLDVVMPVMDGPTFLEYKNRDGRIADIPVIVITSDDTRNQQVRAVEMGANDYIVRPFVPEIVVKRVTNVLESAHNVGKALAGHVN